MKYYFNYSHIFRILKREEWRDLRKANQERIKKLRNKGVYLLAYWFQVDNSGVKHNLSLENSFPCKKNNATAIMIFKNIQLE